MDAQSQPESSPAADAGAGIAVAVGQALARWGGALVRPRAMAAELDPNRRGRDALILGLLVVAGTSVYALAEGVASVYALRNLSGLVVVASVLGRALLPPILTIVAAETVLGRARSHAAFSALIPLVIVGTVVHFARQLGHPLVLTSLGASVVGGLLGVALVAWIRPVVRRAKESDA